MADLRQLRESHRGDELKAALKKFRLRLDDPNVISPEVRHFVQFHSMWLIGTLFQYVGTVKL